MERLNGEVRDREKVMRGLKKVDTAVLTGYQLYHDFMKIREQPGARKGSRGLLQKRIDYLV